MDILKDHFWSKALDPVNQTCSELFVTPLPVAVAADRVLQVAGAGVKSRAWAVYRGSGIGEERRGGSGTRPDTAVSLARCRAAAAFWRVRAEQEWTAPSSTARLGTAGAAPELHTHSWKLRQVWRTVRPGDRPRNPLVTVGTWCTFERISEQRSSASTVERK